MTTSYRSTTVSVSRSLEEIRKLLQRFGASEFSFYEGFENEGDGEEIMAVNFKYKKYPVMFKLNIDYLTEAWLEEAPWTYRRRLSKREYEAKIREQVKPTAMRILANHLKALFNAVEAGLVTFEEIFLAKFVVLQKGKPPMTLGEHMIPVLGEMVEGRLDLPALPAGKKRG